MGGGDATITGKSNLTVSHPKVSDPKFLRYSWHRYPWGNVINKEGLSMRGFQIEKK